MPAPLNFKQIAEDIDIADVAHLLKLEPHKDRFACPTCENERAIQLYPETNTFRCHIAKLSGDCIGLYAHSRGYVGQYKAAKELSEHFATATAVHTAPSTVPQKPAARSQPSAPKAEVVFDPAAFAAKLTYVPDLGITEEEASTFGVGEHRGKLYVALRDEFGHTAGFVSVDNPRFPKTLLKNEAVVKLKRA